MSTVGQAAGGLVGGIVGFFIGGPSGAIYGAQIGLMAGGYLDPPKGPNAKPPSQSDLAVQTSTYGVAIPDVYGTYGTLGNVFWVENNTLVAEPYEAEGGKGGSKQIAGYNIFVTCAVGICRGPIAGIKRIWCSGKLIYDAAGSDLASIIASNEASQLFTLYTGAADQLPDDRMQATLGVANTPAYRGLAYVVFKDFPLADYGNTLMGAQFKFEVYQEDQDVGLTLLQTEVLVANGGNGPTLAAQNSVNDRYAVFAFTDPQYSGYPSGGTVDQRQASFLSSHTEAPLYISGNNTVTIFRNTSPTNIGTLTRDGQTTSNHYFLNNVQKGAIPASYQAEGFTIWIEENGASFIGIGSGPDTAGPGTGDMYLVRTDIASGTTQTGYLKSYNVFGQTPVIVVASGIGYAITDTYTYVFDLETLVVTDTRACSGVSVSHDYSVASVDESGRVWIGFGNGGINGVSRFNATMTGYDLTYGSGDGLNYGCSGVAVQSGILYTAYFYGNSDITCRAYRLPTLAPASTVPLADIIEARSLKSGLLEAMDLDTTLIDQQVRGYRVATVAAIRSSLDPLQAAWPFDVIPDGYQIKFVPRGQTSVATIDISELGAVAGSEKPGVQITASREMASQLPRKVGCTYVDYLREYDTGTGPGAERLNTDATNVLQIELPIVMNATECAGVEETLLYMYWLERHDVTFVLPPTRNNLQPADVVTINGDGATYELRLTSINYLTDGRLECEAKFNGVAIYTPTAVGEEGLSTGRPLSLPGATMAEIMDIPVMDNIQDAPGFTVAVGGILDGWNGGTLARSDDAGQTWTSLQGFTPPGSAIGMTLSTLGVGRIDIRDETSVFQAAILSPGSLSSVTEAQLFNGANHFAVGVNGRWEIIGAKNCVQQDNGNYVLTGLLRGRFGTEWAMGLHTANDHLILLDPAKVRFVAANINTIGQQRLFTAVTNGQSVDQANQYSFTYAGQNLECLAPVYLNGYINQTTEDWVITWVRRTRVGGELRDKIDALLGEVSELYEVEIWNSTYTTLKRTVTALSTATMTYTAAQQVADFGAKQTTLYLRVYQVSATTGRGQALVTSLSRSIYIVYDPNFSSLVAGLHMDGTNGSTTITDIKGKTWTCNGNAAISTAQSKFGGASLALDGSGDYLSTPLHSDFQFGTGNLTISAWIRQNSTAGYQTIFGGKQGYYEMAFQAFGGQLTVTYPYGGGNIDTTGTAMTAGNWYYVELCRISQYVYLFIDGVLRGQGGFAGTIAYTDAIYVGRINYTGGYNEFNGQIDDLRVYKGVGVHSAGYSVPTEAFPNQ